MGVAVVLLGKLLTTEAALERLDLFVDLQDVLLQICLLAEGLGTEGALEWLLLGVGAHVVTEL